MEVPSVPTQATQPKTGSGCLKEIGWFASGAVLPIGSLSYYRKAAGRSVGTALLFFFVFTTFLTVLSTVAIGIAMTGGAQAIRDAYNKGTVPEITIRQGIAEVAGRQPLILIDQQTSSGAMFVAIDTTGQITSIDRSRYNQGFLLTRTELIVLNNTGQYQSIPLRELNALFGKDPLVINADTVSSAWALVSGISTVMIFIILFLWNSVCRLMFIALLALILWGIGSLIRPKIGFGPFLVSGIYAIVPATYLTYLFNRSNVSFLGLQTLLTLMFWAVGLVGSLASDKFFSLESPSRLWMAWIGAPMLLFLGIDLFFKIPSPYGQILLWLVALLTGSIIVGMRLYFHIRALQKAAAPTPPPVV